MNAGQYEGLMARLGEIRDRMPVTTPAAPVEPAKPLAEPALAAGGRHALEQMLEVLDGWVEGQKANHEALDHRGEREPCWERFHPNDIRSMVEDAAHEIGLTTPIGKDKR